MAAIGRALSERWVDLLEALRPDARHELLGLLGEEVHEALLAGERIAANGAGVQAAFLRRKREDIVTQEREHVRELREAIVRLGGAPPGPVAAPAGPRPARTFERLLEDLEEEKREAAASLQAAAVARGAGVEEAEALLRRIRDDEERHLRELVDILGRLDPNP